MIFERLSERERRVVALGLLAAAVILVFFGLIGPYAARYQLYRTTIDDQMFRLERLQAAAQQVPVLRAEITALRETDKNRNLLLEQSTPALAAAQVQQWLVRMVADVGGEVRSVQVARPVAADGFTRISLTLRMTATSTMIGELFPAIESQRPLLFIDNVQARTSRHRGRRQVAAQETGEVDLEFEVFAYMGRTGST